MGRALRNAWQEGLKLAASGFHFNNDIHVQSSVSLYVHCRDYQFNVASFLFLRPPQRPSVQCRFTSTAESISSMSLLFFYGPPQRPSVQCRFTSTAETISSVSLYVHHRDHQFNVTLRPPHRPSVQCRFFFLHPPQRPSVQCRFTSTAETISSMSLFYPFFLRPPQKPSVQCRFMSTAETIISMSLYVHRQRPSVQCRFFFYVHRRDHHFSIALCPPKRPSVHCRFFFFFFLRPPQRPSVQCRFTSTVETISSLSLYVHRRDHRDYYGQSAQVDHLDVFTQF